MSTARGPRDARPPRRSTARPGAPMPTRAAASRAAQAGAHPAQRSTVQVRRLVVLGVLVVLMGLVLAPTVSGFLQQRASITAAQQQIEAEQREIEALEAELALWEDPQHVERQARERLRFVKEGETSFTVIDDTGTDYTEALPGMAPVSEETLAHSPWYGQIWETVTIANEGLPETTTP